MLLVVVSKELSTVKRVTVELSLTLDAVKTQGGKTTVESDRLVNNSARISLNCETARCGTHCGTFFEL